MRFKITSKEEFEEKIASATNGLLLLFHSSDSSLLDLDDYAKEAEDKCKPNDYSVYTINIDNVKLSSADVAKYQIGVTVICCTILKNNSVIYKEINPDPSRLRLHVIC